MDFYEVINRRHSIRDFTDENIPKDMFRFDRLPENISTMDARSVRNELSKIRDVANEISADMAKVLEKNLQPMERRDEAR